MATVEPPCVTTSRTRPPLINDRQSKAPKFSQSKPYSWNPSKKNTSFKRPRPLFGPDGLMTFHCSWHLVNDHLPHSMISIFAVCTMLLRLRVVPHFSSSPFLAWGDFLARSRFAALLSLRKNGGLLVVYMLLWIYEELYWQLETTHILT